MQALAGRHTGSQRDVQSGSRAPLVRSSNTPKAHDAADAFLARDFSRVSVHPEHDFRGEGEMGELDDRPAAPAKEAKKPKCEASATGISLGKSGPIHDGDEYGLRTPINVRGKNLKDVQDSELVGTSVDHTGSMKDRPSAKSKNSDFMAADKIPDDRHVSSVSDHLDYYDNHGGDGSYSRLQMDLYKIPSCSIDTPQGMANSGYRIKRTVKKDGKKVVGIVTKTAEAVEIDGFKSGAGLTAKKEAKVTLREDAPSEKKEKSTTGAGPKKGK